ncbi:hypothetical protein LSH36_581g03034 [Paralvinella palmiformis]|uniref:Coiled-coil domain-containing protein 171 n=1 Tax=Paralvinella palmiformis TaxID=53620 RepID=A0AAD9MV25_9ANNE|nr:hypothetical protein LSH36_581g03034 [Paralvinella palmiformis]
MATTDNGQMGNGNSEASLSSSLSATNYRGNDILQGYQVPSLDVSGYLPDTDMLKSENNSLKSKLRQMMEELQSEQDTVFTLRKRLNCVEKERLEEASRANSEVNRLDCEVTKLRAQLERGEALRQNLEFELAKARREINIEKKSSTERENLITEVNEEMKQKITELTMQMEALCDELEKTKHQAQCEANRFRDIINEKEKILSEYRTDKDALEADRDQLGSGVMQKDKVINDLERMIQDLEDQKRQLADSNRQLMSEVELIKEKDERLRRDYETLQQRIRTLEECIEAERAAHLESKFNSEIIQLRIRDLENALELEKNAKAEAISSAEKITKQLRELQNVYDEERRSSHYTKEKLEKHWQPILRAEKEYAALNKQLHEELEDKRLVIQKLSGQLDNHQKNFNELKQELNKAKKRQIYLEETYSGTTKELELLLESYSLNQTGRQTADKTSGKKKTVTKKKDTLKTQSLAVILEGIRHLFMDYRRKLEDLNADMTRVKTQNEHLVTECQQFKDLMWAKDKAVESTQQGMSQTSKELHKLQAELRDLHIIVRQLQDELRDSRKSLEKERQANRTFNEQVNKMSTKWKTEEQVSLEFLQALYRQLLNVRSGSASQPQQLGGSPCWTDLALYINDQVAALLTDLRHAEEKVHQLEAKLENKNRQLQQMEKTHEEQLAKLSSIADGRTQEWQQQKAEMEKHYMQLLSEIHTRQKRTQALADQAWEKVRMTGSVQQGLEAECTHLRTQFAQCQKEHDTLLAACALLSGALYPMYVRYTELASQRQLLVDQLSNFATFKHQIQALVEALSGDGLRNQKNSRGTGLGLLRFRKGVLAVIVANRLANASQSNCVSNPWVMENDKIMKHGQEMALTWLSSGDLLSAVLSTLADLQKALQKAKEGDSSMDGKKLVSISKNCFQKFVCHFPSMFSSIQRADVTHMSRDHNNLIRRCGKGLLRSLDQLDPGISPVASSQVIVSSLQQYILQFTQRLHDAEVERRDLRIEVSALRQSQEGLSTKAGKAELMEQELIQLRQQELLNEQSQQIQQLGLTLDIQRTEDNEKEYTLSQAVKGLTDAKMELKRQEQRFRQQNKQVLLLEEELKALRDNVRDAESALKTASRYVKSRLALMSNTNVDFGKLLSSDLIPSQLGKPGPDFIACQKLVALFVNCQKQLGSRIVAHQEEIQSHKDHINTLKKELGAACRREYEDEIEKIRFDDYNFSEEPVKLASYVSKNGNIDPDKDVLVNPTEDEFVLLLEDSSDSSDSKPELASYKKKASSSQSPQFKTPRSTQRCSITRRTPTEGKA